jgi:molybdopterin synthase sulfur carrier subunit
MKIIYLTWLRNQIGCAEEEITLPADTKTISDLLDFLESKGTQYKTAFAERKLIYVSRNNNLCEHGEAVADRDEIAFFSPIVGG